MWGHSGHWAGRGDVRKPCPVQSDFRVSDQLGASDFMRHVCEQDLELCCVHVHAIMWFIITDKSLSSKGCTIRFYLLMFIYLFNELMLSNISTISNAIVIFSVALSSAKYRERIKVTKKEQPLEVS